MLSSYTPLPPKEGTTWNQSLEYSTREQPLSHAYDQLKQAGIPADKITVLTPGSQDHIQKEIQTVPTDASEQPGMGNAIGALLGGGVGITGGSVLMALIPGVGPITALGLLGAAVLGAAGATVGAAAGGKIEKVQLRRPSRRRNLPL